MDSQRPTTAPLPIIRAPTCSASSQNVRVVARVRPLSSKELAEQSSECIATSSQSNYGVVRVLSEDKRFEFDSVFAPEATQEDVYVGTAGNMIKESIYSGFNATILAYGQTGSGKTFTMGTDGASSTSNTDALAPPSPSDGVIARAVHDLFYIRQSLPSGPDRVKVEMSYLEIYNEQAIDLLSDDPSSTTLQVRDSKLEGVVVPNLKSYIVSSPSEVRALMAQASNKRATGSTHMNSVSSRSHAICTLNVTIAPLEENEENSPHDMVRAKLTLVDLAGSERIKRTGAEGARMKEGININKGLFVLGQVVSALSELGQQGGKKSNAHIPYRDSKLTRLLQDSLGGNSRTVMIACISPAESNAEETINTLRYAERTRNIKNSAVRNVIGSGLSSSEAAALRKENQHLKMELAQLRDTSLPSLGSSLRSLPSLANTEVMTKLKAQCSSFLAENDLLKERIKVYANEVLDASLRSDKWQAKFEQVVEIAKGQGIDLPDNFSMSQGNIVSQLRNQLEEYKANLLEARTDAAMARATAGAVIASNGDLASATSTLSTPEGTMVEDVNDDFDNDNIINELSAVSGNIEQKEAMLQQMLKERSCRENIQIHLQNSLRLLQSEVDELTIERTQLIEQMNRNMEDNSRRKCNTAMNPVTKRLREQIKSMEERIYDLKQKANEHQKSLHMKEEAEKKCARLTTEISLDKRRRADLQKKLKEASNEIRSEKKAAKQNAARMMKDSQRLKAELNKIKSAAEKQVVVLKRKIDEAAAKEKARLELEKRRKNVEQMRRASLAAAGEGPEVKESRKQELETWINREIECSIIKSQINDYQSQLESAMVEKKRLMKSNTDTVDVTKLESIEDDCSTIRRIIQDLEEIAKNAFSAFQSSDLTWRFIDPYVFKTLSKQEAKHILSYIFDICSDTKHELDLKIADQEIATTLAIDAAVAKERQSHERDIMKLTMEHGEATLNLLESTQGAVNSHILQIIASDGDQHARIQLETKLDSYMKRCMSTGKKFKTDLDKMKESEEGMQQLMDNVAQGISFVPATSRKKRRTTYESYEELDVLEESFEIEIDDSSDYEPTPTPAKKKKKVTKRHIDSPLLGENILDEDTLSNLTVSRLRDVCKKNNLPTTGRKCELQERLKKKLIKPFSSSIKKSVIFEEENPNASFDSENTAVEVKKQLFDENVSEDNNIDKISSESQKLKSAAKETMPIQCSSTDFFQTLMSKPSAKLVKKSSKSEPSLAATRPETAPLSRIDIHGRSPKRKRSPDKGDLVLTPSTSAKKIKPLGFFTSTPRSSPMQTKAPLGNHNRTPVEIKHTESSKKRLIVKRSGCETKKITASEKRRTKQVMNDAVHRALEQCNNILEDL